MTQNLLKGLQKPVRQGGAIRKIGMYMLIHEHFEDGDNAVSQEFCIAWGWFLSKDGVGIRAMPGFSSSSEYAFLLELNNGKGKRTIVLRQTSSFSQDFDLKPQRTEAVMSAIRPGEKLIPLEDVVEIKERLTLTTEKGIATLTGKVLVNEDYYSRAKIKIEYWPDPVHSPDLVFTPVPAGGEGQMRNSVEVKD